MAHPTAQQVVQPTTIMTTQSFFSGLLSPSLLSLSPLQSIIHFLADRDIALFCRVNKEHHAIYPRMRMKEHHTLEEKDWKCIGANNGPIVTAIALYGLAQLTTIPEVSRGQIRCILFQDYSANAPISHSDLPPLLEELTTDDDIMQSSWLPKLTGAEIPVLPESLTKLKLAHLWQSNQPQPMGYDFGFQVALEQPTLQLSSSGNQERPTQFITRILAQAYNLTDVEINVHEVGVIAALPSSITRLNVFVNCHQLPESDSDWPASLRHLTIEMPSLDQLSPFLPPRTLESLELPEGLGYQHYQATMKSVSQMKDLKSIVFGDGIHNDTANLKMDLFALLPRSLTSVTCRGRIIKMQGSLDNCVESLPDSVEVIHFALPNKPVTRWPSSLRELGIYNPDFSQDLSSLPDSVEVLQLPQTYSRTISHWPSHLEQLYLGAQYCDLGSLSRLPSTVRQLWINILMVRRLMSKGLLPPSLDRLYAFGEPDLSRPFDLRLLPQSLRCLYFDHGRPQLLGEEERGADIDMPGASLSIDGLKEVDLEMNYTIRTEIIPQLDANEELEETTGTVSFCVDNTSAGFFASKQLFYREPSKYTSSILYELDYVENSPSYQNKCAKSSEAIERLAIAMKEQPLAGVSLNGVRTNPVEPLSVLRALKDALDRGGVTGTLALIDCSNGHTNFQIKTMASRPAFRSFGGTDTETGGSVAQKMNPPLTDIMLALPHSNITKIKLEKLPGLFDGDLMTVSSSSPFFSTSSSSSSSAHVVSIPPGFAAFCTSLNRMSSLRTIVFRNFPEFADRIGVLQHLTHTLLQPECAQIESLDLSESAIKDQVIHIVELIRHSRTLKHLVLAQSHISVGGLWQLCQAVAVNCTLLTLSVAGNHTGVYGLHALRWTLRQNRTIEIAVCQNDFGDEGIALLYQCRHARLKESSGYYFDHHILGPEIELP